MDALVNPVVFVTRPADGALRFVDALRALRQDFRAVISPAFGLERVPASQLEFDIAVFTSVAGVEHAPRGAGRVAWCVGDATAQAAERAGYAAASSSGFAKDLLEMILAPKPQAASSARMVYFRGEVSREDISAALRAAGFNCRDQIVYRKTPCAPTPEAISVIQKADNLILPLFSAETVTIMAGWPLDFSRSHVVAISEAVGKTAMALRPRSVVAASRPDQDSLAQAVAGLIA